MTLGNRIRAARERLVPKLTQKVIADAFDMTDQAVSEWERDASRPDLDKIPKLARLLKVPTAWLLSGNGDPPAPDSLEVQIERLPAAQRAMLSAMIETLNRQLEPVM